MKRGETVILAAGDFPQKGTEAWQLLTAAQRVICCDRAANLYHRSFRKWPTVTVGDMDSAERPGGIVVRIDEQDTNDLAKAVRYCEAMGWKNPVILGATGKREDHTFGNVFRAMDFGLEVVTDYGRFVPVEGTRSFSVEKGATVSIFVTDPKTKVSSKGLESPLNDVVFENLYCATLNRATSKRVMLTTSARILVYLAD